MFAEGIGEVTAPYVPAFASDHTYHFVVDTGLANLEQLQFGVSDGTFWDNGGAYTITVWQLQSGAVPDVPETPAPYAVAALSLTLAAGWRRRRAARPRS